MKDTFISTITGKDTPVGLAQVIVTIRENN